MNNAPPLVIAGHGTRDLIGVRTAHVLLDRIREMLPGVTVEAGFVELTPPTIEKALKSVLEGSDGAVVVPLMIGTGGHVREDIPESIAVARAVHPDATVVYTRHLGSPQPMLDVVHQRIAAVSEGEDPADVTVVMVGRGTSLADVNADHVRLCRLIEEGGGYARVVPAFIQVASPSVPAALDEALAGGAKRIVVMPHFLFPGRLRTWVNEQSEAWAAFHPEVNVSVAEVIGPCDELAGVVIERYREGVRKARTASGSAAYLAGLLLTGRKVLVVGGGCVARRRVPTLVDAGARVHVVSPEVHDDVRQMAEDGSLTWHQRDFEASDLDEAWYAMAVTDSPEVNATVAAEAERRRIFCVRADRAAAGSAWTPATAGYDGATVAAVVGNDPGRSRRIRDRILEVLAEEEL